MNTKRIFIITILAISYNVSAQIDIRAEIGPVFNGYNNIAYPGNGGTRFSLVDDLKGSASAYYRLSVGYDINNKHSITFLFAPLDMKYKGTYNKDILYGETIFAANTYINAKYRFYSYRLTYRYDIIEDDKIEFGLGLTAKIRQAYISLNSETANSSKKNVGFVPIINFKFKWNYHPRMSLLFEGDALGAKQGRAEDILLANVYKVNDKLNLSLGYRILEGGSDSDEIYTFSMFHYIAFGISYSINFDSKKY